MIWLVAIAFHTALIFAAYKVGANSAGKGIALFFVGVVAFQLVVNGPSSFLEGGCQSYGPQAHDC